MPSAQEPFPSDLHKEARRGLLPGRRRTLRGGREGKERKGSMAEAELPGGWTERRRQQPWPRSVAGRAGRGVSLWGSVAGMPRGVGWGATMLRYLEEEGTE